MLRPSAFQNNGNNGSADNSSSKLVLRPSSFSWGANNNTAADKEEVEPKATENGDEESQNSSTAAGSDTNGDETTEETKSSNPFDSSKVHDADIDDSDSEANKAKPSTSDSQGEKDNTNAASTSSSDAHKKASGIGSLIDTKTLFNTNTTNLFAAATSKTSTIRNGNESNIGFVFGQNIHERIAGATESNVATPTDEVKGESSNSNHSFASAAANSTASTSAAAGASSNGSDAKEGGSSVEDLEKVAREYEESRVQKRKYDEVKTFTGEEDEVNVLDINCKLFAFVASNWEERGPGSLRLNDCKETKCSRVVFRTSGNLRVVLNTKVWKDMVAEKGSEKSIRLTAIDSKDKQVRIFLAMARPDDINNLRSALRERISKEKRKVDEENVAAASTTANHKSGDVTKTNDDDENEPTAKRDRCE